MDVPKVKNFSDWNRDGYRWSGISNMPITLLGHLFTIAHAFHKEAKIGDSTHPSE